MKDEQEVERFVKEEAVRGLQQLAVLAALADAQHGYHLKEVLKEHGINIESGTLYPLLRRLEAKGLLQSEWDTSGSHPRRVYTTTDKGRVALEQVKPVWESFIALTEKILGVPEGEAR